jgi:hypothetical protein
LREVRRTRLRTRLQEAHAAGDVPAEADSDDLAWFLMVVGWGMAIDAQSGATREDLYRKATLALKAWPQ